MPIQDFIGALYFNEGELSSIDIDPKVQFSFYANEKGQPTRVRTMVRVDVPLYEWASEKENDIIFGVMAEASRDFTVAVQHFKDLTHSFWAKRRGNLTAFAYHPSVEGKFSVPGPTAVFHSEIIEPNRVLCLGPREAVGYLLVRVVGDVLTKNYVISNPTGILSVSVANP